MTRLLSIALVLALPALAQDEQQQDAIVEIIVLADTPVVEIRREIRLVEARLYSEFNRLNDDDEYDIYCRKHRPIGSHILRNECKAQMYWRALEDGADPDVRWLVREVPRAKHHERALREKMLTLAKENAELREILAERKALLDAIERRKTRD